MQWLKTILVWSNILLVLATFFCYFATFISPKIFWPATFLGLFFPWLLLANVLFILFWGFKLSKFALLSILCIVFGWKQVKSIVNFHPPGASDSASIRLMSFNTHGFKNADNKLVAKKDLASSFDFSDIDIVCMQEYPHFGKKHFLNTFFLQQTPFKYHSRLPTYGLIIFSRHPLKNHTINYFENGSNGYEYADIHVDGQSFRLFNIHLQSNAVSGTAKKVTESGNLQEKETWLDIKGMMSRYKRAAIKRTEQAEEIAEKIKESPYPVVVCGDLNDTPQSYMFSILATPLKDAFQEKGRGFGFTYAGKIPALRIDYMLTSPSVEILDFNIGKMNFSDHHPVYCTIKTSGK
jgi:endonuclease/exonuclease/phosphatase family metal-dependent hydrolase